MTEKSLISRRSVFNRLCRTGAAVGAASVLICAEAAPARAGYGTCSKCSCAGFHADYRNNNVCDNCGHSYTDHW